MKMKAFALLVTTVAISHFAFAQNSDTSTNPTANTGMGIGMGMGSGMGGGHNGASNSCRNIAAACESAGFRIHDTTGKDIWKDCVKLITSGQTVAGVTANPSDVQACVNKKAQHKQWRQQHGNGAGNSAMPMSGAPSMPTAPTAPTAPSAPASSTQPAAQ